MNFAHLLVVTSLSDEPISVEQLNDVMETNRAPAAAAERLSLRLSLTSSSSSVLLRLKRSELINDQTPVYVARYGRTVRWTQAHVNQVRHTRYAYNKAAFTYTRLGLRVPVPISPTGSSKQSRVFMTHINVIVKLFTDRDVCS